MYIIKAPKNQINDIEKHLPKFIAIPENSFKVIENFKEEL
jgi:hypothetical protein